MGGEEGADREGDVMTSFVKKLGDVQSFSGSRPLPASHG